MWNKFSHALKSKQAQDGSVQSSDVLAGPSISPSKNTVGRKGVFHRDDGSLRLNSPLKLPSIQKVKSTFNLHGNSSQLTLSPDTLPPHPSKLTRRSSQEVLSASRPKATRRSSFNVLVTRRPSIDALRSPSETPRTVTRREESPNSNPTRNRAATFGGSVRSILREANTPGTGKSVRFFARDALPELSQEMDHRPVVSRSTPPEETFLHHLDRSSGSDNNASAMPRFASSSRYHRPSVAEVFSPFASTMDSPSRDQTPHLTNFFDQLDVAPITSLTAGLHVPNLDLPDAHSSTPYTPYMDGGKGSDGGREVAPDSRLPPRLPSVSHDRSTSFSFGHTVFNSMDLLSDSSKRSSSEKSSLISYVGSDMTSGSSSPSVGRNRSVSDTGFMSMMRDTPPKVLEEPNGKLGSFISKEGGAALEPDPFSVNATTYYTPQTMIPTTPPGVSRHVRRASKEESIIFSLQTQLDLQNELCGQFEADLRARDELVAALGKRLAEAEEEDTKKRKFLRAWKKKVAELERTCRFLEDEVEGSRQENMERSVMDEASSEALRMLHRQISGLEREREAWKRTEVVLRDEVKRLETLAAERRNEASVLRESLDSRSEKEQVARHKAVEMTWQVEKEDLMFAIDNIKISNIGLVADLDDFKQQLGARDDEIMALKSENTALKTELSADRDRADRTVQSLEAAEAGKCALAMERDSLKFQVMKLQERTAKAEDAERKVFELEDDLQGLWDMRKSLEKEREQFKNQNREQVDRLKAVTQNLSASEKRVVELGQERQYALDHVSRLQENIRRRDIAAAEESQRNSERAADIEELREQIKRMRQEQSAALEAALQAETSKQIEIDAQARVLLESKAEIERLKSQTRDLQQESADKEVHIVQITKQRAQDKQDLEGLNIALDSKQQELDLLKRRLGVRGTAGNTPAQPSKIAHQRRDSLVYTTPRTARPSSFASENGADSGRERKASVESCTKIPALSRSARVNSFASENGADPGRERKASVESCTKTAALSKSARVNSSTTKVPTPPKPATRGSMGPPPPLKPRSSVIGTPGPRTLTRSSSLASTAGVKARVSKPATAAPTSPHSVEQGEKENADVSSTRRLSKIPTLAQ